MGWSLMLSFLHIGSSCESLKQCLCLVLPSLAQHSHLSSTHATPVFIEKGQVVYYPTVGKKRSATLRRFIAILPSSSYVLAKPHVLQQGQPALIPMFRIWNKRIKAAKCQQDASPGSLYVYSGTFSVWPMELLNSNTEAGVLRNVSSMCLLH